MENETQQPETGLPPGLRVVDFPVHVIGPGTPGEALAKDVIAALNALVEHAKTQGFPPGQATFAASLWISELARDVMMRQTPLRHYAFVTVVKDDNAEEPQDVNAA